MIRIYCDQCGEELLLEEGDRLKARFNKMVVEVMTGLVGGAMNAGNWCHPCVRGAVASTDPDVKEKKDE